MTKEQIKTKMKEREEFIISILKEDPKTTVTGKSIDDTVGITAGNRAMYMRKLMKKYPQIQNVGKKEAEYKWVEDKKPAPKKNPEGYLDLTAKKAIDNVSNQAPTIRQGEVWSTVESNGSTQPIFVLNSLNGAAQCMKLYHENSKNIEITGPDYFQIDIFGISYIGDPSHVTFKPLRYCTKRIAESSDVKLKEARWMIAKVFGIDIPDKKQDDACWVENEELKKRITELTEQMAQMLHEEDDCRVENEKLEKRVTELTEKMSQMLHGEPAPVPENYVDCRTAELAILTEQRDIWKTVALKLLEGRA